jgi:NADH-quinone oxidoreductase subunit C
MTTADGGTEELTPVLQRALLLMEGHVTGYHSQHGDDTVLLDAAHRLEGARALKDDDTLAFDMLMDSTVVDWPDDEPRFEVVDHFFSTRHHHRLRVKYRVTEESPELPSLCPLYGSANWMERESWDMFGVRFSDHPDLRRILLYPEFEGHPLRKDYDKLDAQPIFTPRYHGTRESDG